MFRKSYSRSYLRTTMSFDLSIQGQWQRSSTRSLRGLTPIPLAMAHVSSSHATVLLPTSI
jgi:hypothetical protein